MVSLTAVLVAASCVLAVKSQAPQVKVGQATLIGQYDAVNDVDAFLGIKYASMQRFERPAMVDYPATQQIQATVHAPACKQINNATGYNQYGITEDCGFLEIYRPHVSSQTTSMAGLPVMVWIHGGGGNFGAANAYEGYKFVKEAKAINLPVIVVAINYRLAVWGWVGGKEAEDKNVQNLGLHDQITALKWVQKYIGAFGGDPTKVTLFGQSAGSMFISFHYLNMDSNLFRAGIMQSGTVASVPPLAPSSYQSNYDAFVSAVGCQTAPDTLACMKTIDLNLLESTVNAFVAAPQIYSTRPWGVSIDKEIIPDTPSKLWAQGKFAKKPFISGDVMDEGTLFPKPLPIADINAMWAFFERDYMGKGASWIANQATKDTLAQHYSEDPAQGSPFGTGDETFSFGADYKRVAALYGDLRYHAPRRLFLKDALRVGVQAWSYQFSQPTNTTTPAAFGVFHSLDNSYVFLQVKETDTGYYNLAKLIHSYWVSFAYNLNPNRVGNPSWPTYLPTTSNTDNGNLLDFKIAQTAVIPDNFRNAGISFINSIPEQFGAPRA